MKKILSAYLKNISSITSRGDAREETYYPELKILLELFPVGEDKKVSVTVLPKQTEAGNPDFRVWDGKHNIVGYIEAKTPDTNLDKIESSEQLTRYQQTFPNLILTDFYEFRLYRDGLLVDQVSITRPKATKQLKTTPLTGKAENIETLLGKFFAFSLPRVFNAEELAVELAKRTRFLRDQVIAEELKEQKKGRGDISGFYSAFKKYLVAGLTEKQFADLYSQTITYGLFAARTRADGDFNRKLAFDYIPPTIGILRDVFRFISLGDLPKQMEVIIDDIAAVLNAADINQILHQYYKEGKGEDPIVHFYETFLAQYDPQLRERRGVYYTPEPVVRYIVRSVHHLLKTRFGLEDGLANPEVTLLDPAAGTLTFPAEAIRLAVNEFTQKYGEGGKTSLIRKQILHNFYAFEFMMAPYAIGHLKISFLLESLGYPMREDDRFQLYLTNTLEMEEIEQIDIPGLSSLSEESHLAGRIKKEEPILVILGNPPYSGSSMNPSSKMKSINKGSSYDAGWRINKAGAILPVHKISRKDMEKEQPTFIGELMREYFVVDNQLLGERNPKWLQDDYVKFLRFAQWKINKAGKGIVAMITNHGYLDNPTFRGMRQSLMNTFNEIIILDLHGNINKRETAPDGSKDDNVFNIGQGVAIAMFVKHAGQSGCRIVHDDLYGRQKTKYNWLNSHDLTNVNFQEIQPKTPYYFFVPHATGGIQHYLDWLKINEIFPVNSVGVVTSRDSFVIDFDRKDLENRIFQFQNTDDIPDQTLMETYGLKEKKNWHLKTVRQQVKTDTNWRKKIHPILYRPFDVRFIFYHEAVIERSRRRVMHHMLAGENLALIVPRRVEHVGGWQHIFVSTEITEHVVVSLKTTDYHFPLYIYPISDQTDMFVGQKTPNISPQVFEKLSATFGVEPAPEAIISYIYAIFYCNLYRDKYAEFLRIDFPRVPFVANYDLFLKMAALGERLIDLHLLKSDTLINPVVKYQGQGNSNRIERPHYLPKENHIYINSENYFEGITPEMWDYQIGGYKVLQKYLKDRKDRMMNDPRQYIHIATAIQKTIEIQDEIDNLYLDLENNVIKFS
jgi:hypothetical protein